MIYNIYKPKDLSSFSIVKKVKNITKEKVGHSGTLDPFADGVLVLGVGKSTKKLSNIIQFDKTYEGIIKLGKKTDSMDLTGNIVEEKEVCEISDQSLIDCEKNFVGELLQRTPMYSARKINGVRLYKLARKNIEIKNDYEKEGKKIEALAIKLLNDQIQETIQDLSEMIQQIKNISTYQENCINLITNQLKK